MGFVQASILGALAAVILPILAHLLFRRRFRPVDLGTLRFLKIAVRRDTRRRWLKRYLLLALRLSCVVVLGWEPVCRHPRRFARGSRPHGSAADRLRQP